MGNKDAKFRRASALWSVRMMPSLILGGVRDLGTFLHYMSFIVVNDHELEHKALSAQADSNASCEIAHGGRSGRANTS